MFKSIQKGRGEAGGGEHEVKWLKCRWNYQQAQVNLSNKGHEHDALKHKGLTKNLFS